MPVYEYLCEGCGPFKLMRSMSEYELPADCPLCQASAPRVMLTAPYCSTASPQARLAQAANERIAEGRSSERPWRELLLLHHEPILPRRQARQGESFLVRCWSTIASARAPGASHRPATA